MRSSSKSLIASTTLFATLIAVPLFAGNAEVADRLGKAVAAFREVVSARGEGRMAGAISEAKCIAIVPNLTEVALVAGGKRGHGVVACRLSNNQWSAPAFFSIGGASLGAQAGVQQKSLVILAMNDAGRNDFVAGAFDLDAKAEAGAEVTAGGHSASKNWTDQPIVTYQVSKGLFAGVNVKDTTIRRDDDAMAAMYGSHTKTEDVLAGKVAVPMTAQSFIDEIRRVEAMSGVHHLLALRSPAFCDTRVGDL